MKKEEDYVSNKHLFKRQAFRLLQIKFEACQSFCKIANKGHVSQQS